MAKDLDCMIVGAGLAGSILAWKLMQAGQRIQILHNPQHISASRVAAGIMNPVTGKRLVLQEHIETLLPTAQTFYQSLSHHFGQPFYIPKPMLRVLRNEHEQAAWRKRKHDPRYQPYLSPIAKHDDALMQAQTGYLDTQALLHALHYYFKEHDCLFEDKVDENTIAQHSARYIILCQGWRGMHCPFFSYLPFQPAKGEILTLSSSQKLPDYIINQGKWMLPIEDDTFKLGATYETKHIDETTSHHSADILMDALKDMPLTHKENTNFHIQQHMVGIRPNSKDKQPFLGFHPKHTHIGIFNGFGSKGSLLIPWHAEQMLQHILYQKSLPKQVDIQRFACV